MLRELDRARQEAVSWRTPPWGERIIITEPPAPCDSWVTPETTGQIEYVPTGKDEHSAEELHVEMLRMRRRLEELEEQLNKLGTR